VVQRSHPWNYRYVNNSVYNSCSPLIPRPTQKEESKTEELETLATTPPPLINFRIALSRFIFPSSLGFRTRRLGLNTYVKAGIHVDVTEAETMRYIAKNTSIPIPKVQRVWKCGDTTFITMDFLPGNELQSEWRIMSDATKLWVVEQLKGYVGQLRALKPAVEGGVMSVTGGPLRDGSRVGLRPFGPFQSHDDFHSFLRGSSPLEVYETVGGCEKFIHSHRQRYTTKFSHGDLAPRNVLVKRDGTITGLIDWDSAGWFPEYWEYTKANFTPYAPNDWVERIGEIVGNYDEQLYGERQLYIACGNELTQPRSLFS
jgi:serine/threonine protein kinase